MNSLYLSMERWVGMGRYLEKFVFLCWAFCIIKKHNVDFNHFDILYIHIRCSFHVFLLPGKQKTNSRGEMMISYWDSGPEHNYSISIRRRGSERSRTWVILALLATFGFPPDFLRSIWCRWTQPLSSSASLKTKSTGQVSLIRGRAATKRRNWSTAQCSNLTSLFF